MGCLKISLGGDHERPAVVFRAPHDYKSRIYRMFSCSNSKAREFVPCQLLKAFLPVRNDTRASLDFRTDGRHEGPVGAGARQAEEIARLAAGFFRGGETQSDAAILRPDDSFSGAG